jgi:hypothetical protein
MAGLGSSRGSGESLTSWLRAGPLPVSVWERGVRDLKPNISLSYCPRCVLRTEGRRHYYSKVEWIDPRRVVCDIHDTPLVRAISSPTCLRFPHFEYHTRARLHTLGRWIEEWISQSPSTITGILIFSPHCLQDQIFLALTDGDTAQSFALANWRLWLEGWPLSSHSHGYPMRQLRLVPSQADRLALVAEVWRVWSILAGMDQSAWPALQIAPEAFSRLAQRLKRNWPHLAGRLPFALAAAQ